MCSNLLQSAIARSLLAEFLCESVATFFFTIIAGLSYGTHHDAAIAVGLAAIFLYQSEKAHMNPVVSIGVALCDIEFGWVNLFLRILAQILGGILGGLLAIDGWRKQVLSFRVGGSSTGYKGLLFEILFAALLVLVFLRCRGKTVLAPVVYGLCYLVGYLTSDLSNIFLTGSALLNPALAIGLVIGSASFSKATEEGDIWLFIVGPFIGCLLGVVFYQLTMALDTIYEEETIVTTEEQIRTTVYENKPAPQPGYGNNQGGYGGGQVELQRGAAY